jgi:hypothetical protein
MHIPIFHSKIFGESYTKSLDYFIVICLIKIYALFRLFISISPTNNYTTNFLMLNIRIKSKTAFYLKTIMRHRKYYTIIIVFFLLTFGNAYIFYLLERNKETSRIGSENYSTLNNFSDCIWLIIVTIFTVGFGDLVPRTFPGRILCLLSGFQGLFISSMIINAVYEALIPCAMDQKLLNFLNSHELKSKYKKSASKCILQLFILNKHRLELENGRTRMAVVSKLTKISYVVHSVKLSKDIKNWKNIKRRTVDLSYTIIKPNKNPLQEMERTVNINLNLLEKKLEEIQRNVDLMNIKLREKSKPVTGDNSPTEKKNRAIYASTETSTRYFSQEVQSVVKQNKETVTKINELINRLTHLSQNKIDEHKERLNLLKDEIEKFNMVSFPNVNLYNNYYG